MREGPIEKHLCKLVTRAGGRAYKWVSPGNKGAPDRIVFLRGMCFLVETKSTIGKLSAVQKVQHRELAKHGFDTVVLSSKEQVEAWVDAQMTGLRYSSFLDHMLANPRKDAQIDFVEGLVR